MPLLFLGRNRVTSGFRLADRPDHNGIDIVGDDSSDILCTVDGTVRSSTIITNKNDPTWDGDSTGLDRWGQYKSWRVSDVVPTLDDLAKGGTVTRTMGDQTIVFQFGADDVEEYATAVYKIKSHDVYIVTTDTTVNNDALKTGIYFNEGTVEFFINDYDGFKTVTTIPMDEKYLPPSVVKSVNGNTPDDTGNVTIEIPEGFSGSWNDLTNRPFTDMNALITEIKAQIGYPVISATEPTLTNSNILWIDTSNGGIAKYHNGSAWVAISSVWK